MEVELLYWCHVYESLPFAARTLVHAAVVVVVIVVVVDDAVGGGGGSGGGAVPVD